MSGLKATPGDWYPDLSIDGEWMVVCESELTMDCTLGIKISGCCDSSEEEANARLIAAARDLYEALIMCTKSMGSVLPDFNPHDQAAYDKACAALAKARGES